MEVEKKLKDWLSNQGYPLEMVVAESFRKAGFDVSQSDHYHDPETNILREIDIIAKRSILVGDDIFTDISYVIECKLTNKKPWILFTSENTRPYDPIIEPNYYMGTNIAEDLLLSLGIDEKLNKLTPCYHEQKRHGYGLIQSFSDGPDLAFKAIMSAANSAISIIQESNKPKFGRRCKLIFPLVVIEGRLFESYIQNSSDPEINEIPFGHLMWKGSASERSTIPITVVTNNYIPEFVTKVSLSAIWFIEFCKENLIRIIDEMDKIRDEFE
jgi:hypothetical protein